MVVIIIGVAHRPNLGDLPDSLFPFKMKTESWTPTGSVLRANSRNQGNGFGKGKRKRMNITNQIYMGAEAAMSNALNEVSRPYGVKRLFIVFCAPLLLVLLFYGRHYVF